MFPYHQYGKLKFLIENEKGECVSDMVRCDFSFINAVRGDKTTEYFYVPLLFQEINMMRNSSAEDCEIYKYYDLERMKQPGSCWSRIFAKDIVLWIKSKRWNFGKADDSLSFIILQPSVTGKLVFTLGCWYLEINTVMIGFPCPCQHTFLVIEDLMELMGFKKIIKS